MTEIQPPPERIRGRFHRQTPQNLKDQRNEWIKKAHKSGLPCRVISEMLGLAPEGASHAIKSLGLGRHTKPPREMDARYFIDMDIPMGAVGNSLSRLSEAEKERLFGKTYGSGKSVADFLMDFWRDNS